MRSWISIVAILCSHLLHAQQCRVFIGSYNWDKAKAGIYTCILDTATGKLGTPTAVSSILNPAYLNVSPDGRFIYACTEAQTPGGGSVSSFLFDPTAGALTFINEQKSEGENPVYLSVHPAGKWLVNGNYTGGSISVYPLEADGSISPACQVISFTDYSVNKERQGSAHIHAVCFAPDGVHILAPDLGSDKIRCFDFDTARAKPLRQNAILCVKTMPGSGPRHIAFHPDGRYCYCIEELTGTISAYTYSEGKLDSIQRISGHEGNDEQGYHSADIHISPDGRYLYASNRGNEDNLAIFSIDQQNGRLTAAGYESTGGRHPRNFAIEPSGKFLLVANQESGNVVVFRRDTRTGKLTRTKNRIKIPGASCVKTRYYTH